MSKKMKTMGICLFFILCLSSLSFSEETLTITTYYPSPYGSYRELSSYRMKIGPTYSIPPMTDTDNGKLIVESNISIGTTTPKAMLHVNGSVRFLGGSGDIDNNGNLGPMDFGYYRSYLGTQTTILTDEQFARADMDGDGRVTWDDYSIFQQHYFATPPFDKSVSIRNVHGAYGDYSSAAGHTFYIRDPVGIGTMTPNANAILDLASTTRAFMPPRMTTAQKIAIVPPAAGMVVYDTNLNKLCVYTTKWENLTSS